MRDFTQNEFGFPSFDRRKIAASFEGGDVSSDGGMMPHGYYGSYCFLPLYVFCGDLNNPTSKVLLSN